jgi:hypothetical protein
MMKFLPYLKARRRVLNETYSCQIDGHNSTTSNAKLLQGCYRVSQTHFQNGKRKLNGLSVGAALKLLGKVMTFLTLNTLQ